MTTQSAATVRSRVDATSSALASARMRTTSPGEVFDPNPAMTASSSTPETTTNGSTPACRSTLSRPGEADPSTMRVICGSSPHVGPFQQGDFLPAEHRVAQFVDGQPPPAVVRRSRLASAAGGAAQHRDQCGQLLFGRLALEHLDVRLMRFVLWRSALRLFSLVAHSGMFPCFLGGIWAILRSSSRSAVPM